MQKMVKGSRDKKRQPVDEKDAADTDVADSIEERLRRIELAHVQSSSDAYKFAFFFFMGMVLTIIIYPGVANTIESLKSNSVDVGVKRQVAGDKLEPVITKDEIKVENRKGEAKRAVDEHNQGLSTKAKINKSRQEDLLIGEHEETESDESTYAEIDLDEQSDDTEVNRDQYDDQSSVRKDFPERHKEVEEFADVTAKVGSVPLTLTPTSPDSDKVSVEIQPDQIKHNPEAQDTKRKTERKETSKAKTKTKQKGKQDATKKQTKPAASKKADVKKGNAAGQTNTKMPKEMQDFEPTYLVRTNPKKVFIDGRRIPPMELLPQKPNNSSVKVWMFEEFLSEQECDGLMRVHKQHVEEQSRDGPIMCFDSVATLRKHLQRVGRHKVLVTPADFTAGTTCVNASFSRTLKDWLQGNWSYSTAFYPGESRFAEVFADRVEQAMGLKKENGGKFQITSYASGIGYKAHTDCTETEDKRDRMASVMVYLDTVAEGGETDFPELGIWVRPRKGRALMWNNMDADGNCEPKSIHQAKRVMDGHKFILIRWYYYKSFYSLGKRPPEPPLPARSSGQPRVSCDEYEHGSCRWYDEWNFEHLVEYERQKYTLI